MVKVIYQKPTANITPSGEILDTFYTGRKGCLLALLVANTVSKAQVNALRKEKEASIKIGKEEIQL